MSKIVLHDKAYKKYDLYSYVMATIYYSNILIIFNIEIELQKNIYIYYAL